jgi:hypothetical protein
MMSDRYITVKYRTRWKSDEVMLGVETIKLRGHHHGMVSVDLSQLPNLPDLRVIDLSCNRLESIDLTPLARCRQLQVLNLCENRLSEVNLLPLADCKLQEYLYLNHNKFSYLDLLPLTLCKKLHRLELEGNSLNFYMFGPFLISDIHSRTSVMEKPKLSSQLKYPLLSDRLLAFILSSANMPWLNQFVVNREIQWYDYSKLVQQCGWKRVQVHMLSMVDLLSDDIWVEGQYEFFKTLGFSELAGFDGDLSSLMSKISPTLDYEEVREKFHDLIIDSLFTQFNQNGCTHFFDTHAMSITKASILIPKLLSRRSKEMERITLQIKKNKINLRPLWLTSYGFKILSILGMSTSTNMKGFQKVRKGLKRLGFSINLERNIEDTTSVGDVIMSHRMMWYILRLASQRGKGGLEWDCGLLSPPIFS